MSIAPLPISSATASGMSGMQAAQRSLDASAHNIANLQTPGFQRSQVVQTEAPNTVGLNANAQQAPATNAKPGGEGFARLADDIVAQHTSVYTFAANLKTVQAQDEMLGSLLDARA